TAVAGAAGPPSSPARADHSRPRGLRLVPVLSIAFWLGRPSRNADGAYAASETARAAGGLAACCPPPLRNDLLGRPQRRRHPPGGDSPSPCVGEARGAARGEAA